MSNSIGGSATASGINFEAKLAAWAAVGVLAEQAVSPMWSLPSEAHYVQIRCQFGEPVDDLLIGTANGGFVFVQAKRQLSQTDNPDSDLAKSLDQCVRQFHAHRTPKEKPWQRPLSANQDRLVIATTGQAAAWVRRDAPCLLRRFREDRGQATLSDAAANESEARLAATLTGHVERSWQRTAGSAAFAEELRPFWELLRFSCFDLDEDGAERAAALSVLRTGVLCNPPSAEAALSILNAFCSELAERRMGATREDLVAVFSSQATPLQVLGPLSFRADFDRLRSNTRSTLASLQDFAEIRCGELRVRLDRAPVRSTIQAASTLGHFLITGEPGSGKSGAECRFVEELLAAGRDVVLLSADRQEAGSLGALRNELGLEHELTETLTVWTGDQPGFLILEGLDAARSDRGTKLYQDLIADVQRSAPRWVIAASIRIFDLQASARYQELFPSERIGESAGEALPGVHHVFVPCLTDEELAEAAVQAPPLGPLIAAARLADRGAFSELLRRPFGLRLAAALVAAGTSTGELIAMRSDVELMERYWQARVVGEHNAGRSREGVCRRLAEQMVDRRELHAVVSELQTSDNAALAELLSVGVLVEWRAHATAQPTRDVVAFAHNILFDYAVARLLLDSTPRNLRDRLAQDRTSVLALHPSLALHFERLWWRDPTRRAFFDCSMELLDESVPRIGQLYGPGVVVRLAGTLADFEPLLSGLEQSDGRREQSEVLVGLVVAGLIANEVRLVGSDALPWCALARELAQRAARRTVWPLHSLLAALGKSCAEMTPRERSDTLAAAATIFDFVWERAPDQRRGVLSVATELLGRLSETAPEVCEARLEKLLAAGNTDPDVVNGLFELAGEVPELTRATPRYAARLYRVVLTARDPPETPISVWDSQIISVVSNLRQVFSNIKYQLGQAFAGFLATAPLEALDALDAALTGRSPRRVDEPPPATFVFGAHQAALEEDHSGIWDHDGAAYQPHEVMLDAFFVRVAGLASRGADSELDSIVAAVVARHGQAVLWRRLLTAGARQPETLGRRLLAAAVAEPILRSPSTRYAACRCIEAVHAVLHDSDKKNLEDQISELTEQGAPRRYGSIEDVRNRLLRRLSRRGLASSRARALLQDLPPAEPGDETDDEPRPVRDLSPEEFAELRARRLGLDRAHGPSRDFDHALEPMRDLARQYLNDVPSADQAAGVCSALSTLQVQIAPAEEAGVQAELVTEGHGLLARLAARLARCPSVSVDSPCFLLVRQILLTNCLHPIPLPRPDDDAQFDQSPGRGCQPRTEAAEGLLPLARRSEPAPEILNAIETLSGDPCAVVRHVIVQGLDALLRPAPNLFWRIVDAIVAAERSRVVTEDMVGLLDDLPQEFDDAAVERSLAVLGRFADSTELRRECGRLWLRRYLRSAHPGASAQVWRLAEGPANAGDVLQTLIPQMRDDLAWRSSRSEERQGRAWRLADRIAEFGVSAWRRISDEADAWRRANPEAPIPEELKSQLRSLHGVLEQLATELYFASGAQDDQPVLESGSERDARERFFGRALPLIQRLGETGIPAVTHELIRTLAAYRNVDAKRSFVTIGALVVTAECQGYQYESIAADVLDKLVREYLVDHARLLRTDAECREALLAILNAFVGWPKLAKLVFRLGEALR